MYQLGYDPRKLKFGVFTDCKNGVKKLPVSCSNRLWYNIFRIRLFHSNGFPERTNKSVPKAVGGSGKFHDVQQNVYMYSI